LVEGVLDLPKVILVRHGETDWNKVRRIQGGVSDTPLSETGKRQAEEVALRLKTEKITAIYSSPLQRALHTAQAVARYHNLTVQTDPALKEINAGELEGTLAAELKSRFDEYICRGDHDHQLTRLPGGESLLEVQERSWGAVKSYLDTHSEGTIVVVTHYFVINCLVCKVLNLPLEEIVHLRLSTGTISVFVVENDTTRLELFNDSCHKLS
jgi:broad specificity phosphatase PhoE